MKGGTSVALAATPDPSPSGGLVTLDAAITPQVAAPGQIVPASGFVDFRDEATTLARVPLDPTGRARISTTSLTVGAHHLVAVYDGDSNDAESTSNRVVQTVLAGPGPTVLPVVRYGATIPSAVVVTFSTPLDPARARDPGNYRSVGPGRRPITVDAAAYTPLADDVLLLLTSNPNPRRSYRITVVGTSPTGTTDIYGNPLDGAHTGRPGSHFTMVLRPLHLFGHHMPTGPRHQPRAHSR